MIITTRNGLTFDTDRDLSAAERHILQKLFAWESMATSLQQFKEKKEEALRKGWNRSGPVKGGPAFRTIVSDMQQKVAARLGK
ncbi:MAG: hypothetical protein DRH56_09710 [Deltaproteobacteria bacterium]|nr:MAG: hypothetical protein DRH56_09710 [Deltaproteobacteria bacterium]